MRPHHVPARCDAADDARQLDRRGFHRALADGHVERLVGIPAVMEVLDQPIRRRHQPGLLARQIDARLLSVAELVAYFTMRSMPSLSPSM